MEKQFFFHFDGNFYSMVHVVSFITVPNGYQLKLTDGRLVTVPVESGFAKYISVYNPSMGGSYNAQD